MDPAMASGTPTAANVEADTEEDASGYFKLAHDILCECKAAGNINDLNTTIHLLYRAAHILLPAHPELSGCLNSLSGALATRFSYTADLQDVQLATVFSGAAGIELQLAPTLDVRFWIESETDVAAIEDSPDDMMAFASDILPRFNQAVDSENLKTSIFLHREALASRAAHPQRWSSLLELSDALLIEFRMTGELTGLQEAISLLKELHVIQPNRWASLCAALVMEGVKLADPLQMWKLEAVDLFRNAMKCDEEAMDLGTSGAGFVEAFKNSGDLSALDTGIAQLKEAQFTLSWGHSGKGRILNSLADAVQTRFEQRGDPGDMDEAVNLLWESLTVHPPSHPNHHYCLSQLATSLYRRSKHRGCPQDIEPAVQLYREALALHPSSHPNRYSSLNNLAVAVRTRFDQWGDLRDIDEAIHLLREALTLCPLPHPDRLGNLAIAIITRFKLRGDPPDIDEAVRLHRQAITLSSAPNPDHLTNLANTVITRFGQRGDPQDIDEAIELHREALTLYHSQHPARGDCLNSLASAVQTRFERQRNPQDMDEAIRLYQEAVTLHPAHGGFLRNLAHAMENRFRLRGDPEDIDRAVELYHKALEHYPSSHPDRGSALNNLGSVLEQAYMGFWYITHRCGSDTLLYINIAN
ncbi:hypothetical protein DFH07DRAFT_1015389 [Mycena maculata]|uniref:TPR-like protein n=1 Tax=Mycena maculata TaxID=230809 RepID=A0AAD7H8N4_9AGAR|nr:hypothetical protein DFH07DRAFT_1015389 [Mycena maculata]